MIVVDEVHYLLAGSAHEQRASLNVLKFLSNQLKCAIVVVDDLYRQPLGKPYLILAVGFPSSCHFRSFMLSPTFEAQRKVFRTCGVSDRSQDVRCPKWLEQWV